MKVVLQILAGFRHVGLVCTKLPTLHICDKNKEQWSRLQLCSFFFFTLFPSLLRRAYRIDVLGLDSGIQQCRKIDPAVLRRACLAYQVVLELRRFRLSIKTLPPVVTRQLFFLVWSYFFASWLFFFFLTTGGFTSVTSLEIGKVGIQQLLVSII